MMPLPSRAPHAGDATANRARASASRSPQPEDNACGGPCSVDLSEEVGNARRMRDILLMSSSSRARHLSVKALERAFSWAEYWEDLLRERSHDAAWLRELDARLGVLAVEPGAELPSGPLTRETLGHVRVELLRLVSVRLIRGVAVSCACVQVCDGLRACG